MDFDFACLLIAEQFEMIAPSVVASVDLAISAFLTAEKEKTSSRHHSCEAGLVGQQESLKKQSDTLRYRMKKLTTSSSECKKSPTLRESIMKKDERMKVVLDEDLTQAGEGLKVSGTDLVNLDEQKAEWLLGMTNGLLLFISSQTPIVKRLLQNTSDVVLDAGRHRWEMEVAGKLHWELGFTYPSTSCKGREEDCWLGWDSDSNGFEFFNGVDMAWHRGMAYEVPVASRFEQIGMFHSFPGGLISFVGVGNTTPLFSFCTGVFTDHLHPAACPSHDNQGTNRRPIRICSVARAAAMY
ncbi:uncharacterized protein LOC108940423 [Scleropages formosus]|uniref:uncharacterized protein LOC108940423 n=1 Tax=Scleropages formosus TaxID=113540 RepID=UPI0010FA9036|nr:uncharacterized protein LOC108940423 [Scleropages formosus]